MIQFILKCRHGIALLVRTYTTIIYQNIFVCAHNYTHALPTWVQSSRSSTSGSKQAGVWGNFPSFLALASKGSCDKILIFFVGFKFQLQSSGASSTHRVSVDGMDFKFASKQLTLYYAKPTLSRIPTVIQEADFVQDNKAWEDFVLGNPLAFATIFFRTWIFGCLACIENRNWDCTAHGNLFLIVKL